MCHLLQLLDDGTGRDPLQVHNFGKAASYLFRPCTNEDGSPDEVCSTATILIQLRGITNLDDTCF